MRERINQGRHRSCWVTSADDLYVSGSFLKTSGAVYASCCGDISCRGTSCWDMSCRDMSSDTLDMTVLSSATSGDALAWQDVVHPGVPATHMYLLALLQHAVMAHNNGTQFWHAVIARLVRNMSQLEIISIYASVRVRV